MLHCLTSLLEKLLSETTAAPPSPLCSAGVTLYGGPRASSELNIPEARSFHHEYSSLACTIEFVDDVYAAIDHIHKHVRQSDLHFILDNSFLKFFFHHIPSPQLETAVSRYCRPAFF